MKDDLLNMEPKKDLKKPLIYGAVGFLVFIVIVIAVAIFQNSSSKENSNEIIPPAEKPAQVKEEKTQFKPLAVEETSQKEEPLALEEKKEPQQKAEEKTKVEEKIEKPEVTETVKTEPQKSVKPEVTKNVEKPKKEHKAKTGKYYIQVAALLKNATPNKKFLALIKKQGYDYKFYHTNIVKNGQKIKVTKILIGPFKSKEEAKKELPKIKRTISQTAYIFKAK